MFYCKDWRCNKTSCSLSKKINNSLEYNLCKSCKKERIEHHCSSCVFGKKTSDPNKYLCSIDNTIGIK